MPRKFDILTSDVQPASPTPSTVILIVPIHVVPGTIDDGPVIVDGTSILRRFAAAAGAAALATDAGASVVVAVGVVETVGTVVVGKSDVGTAVVVSIDTAVVGLLSVGAVVVVSIVGPVVTFSTGAAGELISSVVVVVVVVGAGETVAGGAASFVVVTCTGGTGAVAVGSSKTGHRGVGTVEVLVGTGVVVSGTSACGRAQYSSTTGCSTIG
ncbi:hypothetical protein CH302_01610 [Rhodococcus sp. 15-2388-1-1a]|nr:hypothetical protein CH302_01610 [Rhodococcus sp. 15-2388-1-1a]